MTAYDHCCNLCGDRGAELRDGRLGRYAVTCDTCEERKGSHLVRTGQGYASRLVRRTPEPALAGFR